MLIYFNYLNYSNYSNYSNYLIIIIVNNKILKTSKSIIFIVLELILIVCTNK